MLKQITHRPAAGQFRDKANEGAADLSLKQSALPELDVCPELQFTECWRKTYMYTQRVPTLAPASFYFLALPCSFSDLKLVCSGCIFNALPKQSTLAVLSR